MSKELNPRPTIGNDKLEPDTATEQKIGFRLFLKLLRHVAKDSSRRMKHKQEIP